MHPHTIQYSMLLQSEPPRALQRFAALQPLLKHNSCRNRAATVRVLSRLANSRYVSLQGLWVEQLCRLVFDREECRGRREEEDRPNTLGSEAGARPTLPLQKSHIGWKNAAARSQSKAATCKADLIDRKRPIHRTGTSLASAPAELCKKSQAEEAVELFKMGQD